MIRPVLCVALFVVSLDMATAAPPQPTLDPLLRVVDLNVGESQTVKLSNNEEVTVKLLDLKEQRDSIRNAVRHSEVKLQIGDETVTLVSALYHVPRKVAGVQVDCPVTKGYGAANSKGNPWGLTKDARLRLWPGDSPLTRPNTFRYPLKQKWFASATQTGNEPVYVDGGEMPRNKNIYYHYGFDFGGTEGMIEIVAATEGLVVSSGDARLPGYEDSPIKPRYDVIYLLDPRGWYYRYSHLQSIDPAIRPGQSVKIGQRLGVLGKEGGSGGWSHLHFDITFRQPSGKWGISDAYALCREAYIREYQPKLLACARPHHFALVGDGVTLDGSRSWAQSGIDSYEWTFADGKQATGATQKRVYDKPGVYSEILKVTDADGRIDYDFAIVHVLDAEKLDELPPSIHANYSPTDARAGDKLTFKVRTFRTTDGKETWDFGDGSPTVEVRSDGNVEKLAKDGYAVTEHTFKKPGHYIVRVQRTDRRGYSATAHLHVLVK